jgi:hypothetical protein
VETHPADRQKKSREAKRAQGLVLKSFWVPTSELERIKKYIKKVNKEKGVEGCNS